MLDRSFENVERFFMLNAKRILTPAEKVDALKLLEMQRHAQLMFTSCGWFFDEITGLEATQILQLLTGPCIWQKHLLRKIWQCLCGETFTGPE